MRRFLDISFNKISSLSAELSNLDGLSTLNLSFNTLGVFPDVLSCMTCLHELNLDSTGGGWSTACMCWAQHCIARFNLVLTHVSLASCSTI